jgi:DNA-binding MarR family transcriptional regulator
MPDRRPRSGEDLRFRVLNWIGIIDQLSTTLANRLLADTDLPLPQFILLNHMNHHPERTQTVGEIARAFQQPQPGITKTVRKLVDKGFIAEAPNPADGRSKLLTRTAAGERAYGAARERLARHAGGLFDDWSEPELDALFAGLDRLKQRLDGPDWRRIAEGDGDLPE